MQGFFLMVYGPLGYILLYPSLCVTICLKILILRWFYLYGTKRKIKKPGYPVLIFNNNQVIQTPYQKHLGLFLDEKLNFGEHLRYITNKVFQYIHWATT